MSNLFINLILNNNCSHQRTKKRCMYKLLGENFNHSLLMDIHHYMMIMLPKYELIDVKCKKEAKRDDFK